MLGNTETGWKCPGCSRCYAPWVPKCDTCGGVSGTITTIPCQHTWGSWTDMGVSCTKCGEFTEGSKVYDARYHDDQFSCNLSNCPICSKGGTQDV